MVFEEKVHNIHLHSTFKVPVRESVEIFKREFEETGTDKVCFLSIPTHGASRNDDLQNLKTLYYKLAFSPKAYAFAGLEYDLSLDKDLLAKELLIQAETAYRVGFDGFKMLEGAPSLRKFLGFELCDEVYEPFYSFMEEKGLPIVMHLAHPKVFWDAEKISEYWKNRGCLYDETFPSFKALHEEVFRIMEKHPNLKLILAHLGFWGDDLDEAGRFLSYPNTGLDLTPGGEQFFAMLENGKESTLDFFREFNDRLYFGTDMYNFEYDGEKSWKTAIHNRPDFVRNFLSTDTEHYYIKESDKYTGIGLEKKYRDKIYRENFEKLLKEPRKIDLDYCIKKTEFYAIKEPQGTLREYDLKCMKWDFNELKNSEAK